MQHTDQIQALSEFLLEYATTLMGAGVHTNRAVRNISRIAAAYGYSADMTIFQRNITMSLICKDDETLRRTSVRKLKPLAFNLNLIQQLSELSWLPVDNNVSIAEMEQAFRSMVRTKRFSRWTDLLLVSVGNAAFCRLFNGDLWAMLTVFAATMLGFLAKQQLTRLKYNPLGVIILSAFTASMAAACAVLFQIGSMLHGVHTGADRLLHGLRAVHLRCGKKAHLASGAADALGGGVDLLPGHAHIFGDAHIFLSSRNVFKRKKGTLLYDGALSAAGKSSTLMPPRSIGDAMSAAPPRRASTVTGTYSRTGPDTRQTVSPSSPGRMADSGTE